MSPADGKHWKKTWQQPRNNFWFVFNFFWMHATKANPTPASAAAAQSKSNSSGYKLHNSRYQSNSIEE